MFLNKLTFVSTIKYCKSWISLLSGQIVFLIIFLFVFTISMFGLVIIPSVSYLVVGYNVFDSKTIKITNANDIGILKSLEKNHYVKLRWDFGNPAFQFLDTDEFRIDLLRLTHADDIPYSCSFDIDIRAKQITIHDVERCAVKSSLPTFISEVSTIIKTIEPHAIYIHERAILEKEKTDSWK